MLTAASAVIDITIPTAITDGKLDLSRIVGNKVPRRKRAPRMNLLT